MADYHLLKAEKEYSSPFTFSDNITYAEGYTKAVEDLSKMNNVTLV